MSADDDRIEEALARIVERRGTGGSVSIEAILAENPDLEEPLRARLRVFRMLDDLRQPQDGTGEASGVIESLSRAGRSIRPVSVPDTASDDPAPVAIPRTPSGRWGRYSLQGEIARGGVGVVMKARDPDLGRDVALKVLREEYASSEDVLQRFVEEAQIGGQLQHPGIVPVYELGLGSDGQPYFVMKLVRGKTLASLLLERGTPALDRPRFLSVFQAVSQTVAYAHERRIVHRDLKPSNVMVGAFGEVQVLDWGMAKVLARGGAADDLREAGEAPLSLVQTVRSSSGSAPSIEGSVLGTPQYMAPEQARGQVDGLDERADVFSLGAILCEILTGQPPYAGTDREVLVAAAQAHLGPAHQRLRSSGTDEALVSLAIRCLAAEKSDRPRDAGVLAREITSYLASLEERARSAEVAAGESRVLVTQERRARRLTLSLSAAVLSLVILGAGGWSWIAHQRRTRAESASRQVAHALEEVTRLRGKAEAAGSEAALPLWRETLTLARHAQGVAESNEADEETRARVMASIAGIEVAQRSAEAAAEQERRDEAAIARFDEIRELAGETWNWKASSAAYAEAFKQYLGGELETLGVDETVRRIDASKIRAPLVLALTFWIRAREHTREDLTFLVALGARVDSGTWRAKVRRATTDIEALRTLASEVNFDEVDLQDVLDLATRLGQGGDPGRAAALALEAWRRNPGDYWACFTCATWNQRSSPPRYQEALRFYTAALALRPRSVAVRINLGNLLRDHGEIDRALAEFREAVRLAPSFATAHGGLGTTLYFKGDLDGAIQAHLEALRLDPNSPNQHLSLGRDYLAKRDFERALAEYRAAIKLDPNLAMAYVGLGGALLRTGDRAGAARAFRKAIQLDSTDSAARNNLGAVLHMNSEHEGAIVEFREAIRLDSRNAEAHRNLAIVLKTRGRLRESLEARRKAHEWGSQLTGWAHPSAQELKEAEHFVAVSDRLVAFVAGKVAPSTAGDALDMAQVGYLEASYAAASMAWERGFSMDPSQAEDLKAFYRYNAACAAALASSGKGTDAATLDAAARDRWRRQAIEWLRADLDARSKAGDAKSVRAQLEHWKQDSDFAGLRDEAELSKLSAEDQSLCRALWREVDARLAGLSRSK